MKLSIIIPVYGVERYIGQCANSLSPLFKNSEIEIIFVNDGTKDNSINILKETISNCNNVKIIHRNNGGLSAARNTGLEHATGEYIYFVDSDDFIDAEAFEKLFQSGYISDADIIVGDFYKVDENSNLILDLDSYSIGCKIEKSDAWKFFVKYHKKVSSVVWRCIYKKSLIEENKLRFHEGVVFEDMEWSPIIFNKAKNVHYEAIVFYYYRVRNNSIMNSSVSEKKINDAFDVSNSLIRYGNTKVNRSDVDFFYRAGLFAILSEVYKVSPDTSKTVWRNTSNIYKVMTKYYSMYRIVAKILFILPNKLTHKLLKIVFS